MRVADGLIGIDHHTPAKNRLDAGIKVLIREHGDCKSFIGNCHKEYGRISASADRNLLFGILALQLDFILRDQLITAMHTWMLAKERSLGEIHNEPTKIEAKKAE